MINQSDQPNQFALLSHILISIEITNSEWSVWYERFCMFLCFSFEVSGFTPQIALAAGTKLVSLIIHSLFYNGVVDLICWLDLWHKISLQFVSLYHFYACFITIFTEYFPVHSLLLVSVLYITVVTMTRFIPPTPCGGGLDYLHRSPCES
jgi:hypothetical protein